MMDGRTKNIVSSVEFVSFSTEILGIGKPDT